jgi:uncharacterized protein YbjT (DUF2867 family)
MAVLHADIERLIAAAGLESTIIRPGMFASNALFWWATAIRADGVVRWPYGAAETAPVDDRDVAAVAARTLYQVEQARPLAGLRPLHHDRATLVQQTRYIDIADERWDANAAFIAAARTVVPRLLAEITRLRALLKDPPTTTLDYCSGWVCVSASDVARRSDG